MLELFQAVTRILF